MGTTLTAALFSGGRAALAHRRSRAFRLRDGQLRRIVTSSPLACSPMLARHADGRPGPFGRCGLAGPADRRPVPAVCRRTRPGHGRPNALFILTLRAYPPTRWPAGRLSRGRAHVSRSTPYPLRKGRCTGKAAPAARRDAGPHISGDMPGGRSASVFLPDAPRLTVIPWRERYLPPFSRANPGITRAPWTIRQDYPGGKAPATGTRPCNLTR